MYCMLITVSLTCISWTVGTFLCQPCMVDEHNVDKLYNQVTFETDDTYRLSAIGNSLLIGNRCKCICLENTTICSGRRWICTRWATGNVRASERMLRLLFTIMNARKRIRTTASGGVRGRICGHRATKANRSPSKSMTRITMEVTTKSVSAQHL